MSNKRGTILKFWGDVNKIVVERIEIHSVLGGKVTTEFIDVTELDPNKIRILVSSDEKINKGLFVCPSYDGIWCFAARQLDDVRKLPEDWIYDTSGDVPRVGNTSVLVVDAYRMRGERLNWDVMIVR